MAYKRTKRKKHGFLKTLLYLFLFFLLLIMIAGIGIVAYYYPKVPQLNTTLFEYSQNAIIYDRYGQPYQNLQGEENRQTVLSEEIPEQIKNAFIAIEDKRFYKHNGVDIFGIGRAVLEVITNKNLTGSGGSTITQQLIKLTHLSSEKTIERKFDEWILAIRLEQVYSKDQIITAYLNKVNFHGAEGIQAAAQQYFGKNVNELDLAETAILAAIPNSPSYYDPYTYTENQEIIYQENGPIVLNPNNETRALNVINEMIDQGMITEEEGNTAKEEIKNNPGLQYNNPNRVYSYFTDAIYQEVLFDLQDALELSEDEVVKFMNTSGIKIYSTVDPNVQAILEKSSQNDSLYPAMSDNAYLVNQLTGSNYKPEVAMTIVNNEDGSVLGLVGGRENNASLTLNRATSKFQTGSVTKPVTTYGPALEEEIITLSSIYSDQPINIAGWQPKNSSNTFIGPTTIRNAIVNSINTIAVQVNQDLSISKSADYAKQLGLTLDSDDYNSAALALGGYSTGQSTIQMASAFSTFPRGGEYIKPYLYTSVIDDKGNVLLTNEKDTNQVFSPETSFLITDVLKQVCTEGTTNIKLVETEVAGKTGTTDGLVNCWFCGYTPTYSMAIWYGYDVNNVTIDNVNYPLTIDVFGGSKPGPAAMFENVMLSLEPYSSLKTFSKPATVVEEKIESDNNKDSSSEANKDSEVTQEVTETALPSFTEYYIPGTEPEENQGNANHEDLYYYYYDPTEHAIN